MSPLEDRPSRREAMRDEQLDAIERNALRQANDICAARQYNSLAEYHAALDAMTTAILRNKGIYT